MKSNIFYGLLSTFMILSFFLALTFAINSRPWEQFMIVIVTITAFGVIPSVILTIIHVVQRNIQKQREKQKTEPKPTPEIETKQKTEPKPSPELVTSKGKILIGMIQKRLARGEISIQEFQELKKEISS